MGVPFLSTNAGYNILQVNTSGENEETRFTLPSGRITISNYGIVSSGLERHLGNATNKWGNLYLSGTVQGASSEKLKQEIAPVDDRLFQAWSEVEFCQYRLRHGDRRNHIVVTAETIEQTLEANE